MKLRPLFLVAALSLAGVGCPGANTGTATQKDSVRTSGKAPDFTLRDLSGRDVRLSDYLGKQVVLLDFWATWCVPCEAALPHIEALYQKYKDRGFVVLGIAMDDAKTVAQVPSFAQRYNLSFPVLLDEESKAVQLYNPKATAPYQVLIGKDGSIVKERQGYNAGDEKMLEQEVSGLLTAAGQQ